MTKLNGSYITLPKSVPCIIGKKNWNTKEDNGKSLINLLHVGAGEKASQDEATSNSSQ